MRTWLQASILLFALTLSASAQRGGFGFGGHGGFGFGGRGGFGRAGFARERGGAFFGYPFLYDDYYVSGSMASVPSQPVVIVQPSSAPAPAPETKADPLLIEWQGDRYVKVGGDTTKSQPILQTAQPATTTARGNPPEDLPPAVLVYRDGHREEVRDYVIANGMLYSRMDYWQQGSWKKDIQLSALDIPATIQASRENGVKFLLPSGPNEVITRP